MSDSPTADKTIASGLVDATTTLNAQLDTNVSNNELENVALRFDENLRQHKDASWMAPQVPSRIAAVLKLLHAVLRSTGSTRSLDTTDPHHEQTIVPDLVGRFEIGESVGRGAFGVVYRAHDPLLHRTVAIKAVCRRSGEPSASGDDRLREARAAAKLNHPNLVPLYEVLDDDDFHYLISEFCEGPTLKQFLEGQSTHAIEAENGGTKKQTIPISWAVAITTKLGLAISHAHSRGLVHRDIKPSNVILMSEQAQGELLPFTPRLTDFGLVLDAENELETESHGKLAGTVLYMAPEQIMGDARFDVKLSDIYSLGLLLYQMLAGEIPYKDGSPAEMLRKICVDPVPPILHRGSSIPRDLWAICEKALKKDPTQRYESAQMLVNDLLRFEEGRSVTARPQGFIERSCLTIQRAPWVSALSIALVCIMVASTVALATSNQQLREQQQSREIAIQKALASKQKAVLAEQQTLAALKAVKLQRELTLASEQKALGIAFRSDVSNAFAALARNDFATTVSIIDDIKGYAGQNWCERLDFRLLNTLAHDGWRRLDSFDQAIEGIVPFPKSERFAVVGGSDFFRVHDSNDGAVIREIFINDFSQIHSIAISPDENLIAVGGSADSSFSLLSFPLWPMRRNFVSVFDLEGQKPLKKMSGFDATISSLAFFRQSRQLAVGARYEPIQIFSLDSDQSPTVCPSNRRNESLFVSPKNELIWMASKKEVSIQAFPHAKHDMELDAINNRDTLSINPNTQPSAPSAPSIVTPNDRDGDGQLLFSQIGTSLDGRWLATAIYNKNFAYLWDLKREPRRPITLENQHGVLNSICVSPKGKHVVAGTMGGGLVDWEIPDDLVLATDQNPETLSTLNPKRHQVFHGASVSAITIDDEGKQFSGSNDGDVVMSRLDDEHSIRRQLRIENGSTALDITSDGSLAIVGMMDGSILGLNLLTGEMHPLADLSDAIITQIAISNEGGLVVASDCNGRVWLAKMADIGAANLTSHTKVKWTQLPGPSDPGPPNTDVSQLQFIKDDSQLIVQFGVSFLQWIDLTSLKTLKMFHSPTSMDVICFPDPDTVLSIGDSIYQIRLDSIVQSQTDPKLRDVRSVCRDTTSGAIHVGCADGKIRTLDSAGKVQAISRSWNPLPSTPHVNRSITAIQCSSDGQILITGSDMGDVAIWDAETLRFLGTIWTAGTGDDLVKIEVSNNGKTIVTHQREWDLTDGISNGVIRWLHLDEAIR